MNLTLSSRFNRTGFGHMSFNINSQISTVVFSGAGELEMGTELRLTAAMCAQLGRLLYPGDVLEIDTENYTVTINGEPVAEAYQGAFFELLPGLTTLAYRDTAASRNLQLTVQYTNQYL